MPALYRAGASFASGCGRRYEKARVACLVSFPFVPSNGRAMALTQPKGKHVGKGPRRIVHDMELAAHQHNEPAPRPVAKRSPHPPRKDDQARGIGHAQNSPHDELGMLETEGGNGPLGDAGQEQRPNEGSGNGAREGEVVIVVHEARIDIGSRSAVD